VKISPFANLLLLDRAEQRRLAVEQTNQRLPDFAADSLIVNRSECFEVDLVDQLPVKRELEFLILRLERRFAPRRALQEPMLPAQL